MRSATNSKVILGDVLLSGVDGNKVTTFRPAFPRNITYFGWGWNQFALQDHMGEWWLPTGQGLYRFPAVSLEALAHTPPRAVYKTRDGLGADDVFRVYEDARGDVWISTLSTVKGNPVGRWERTTNTIRVFPETAGLSSPWSFGEDGKGDLWIGTSEGLMRYAAGRFTSFTHADGLPIGSIRAIHSDRSGRLWLASGQGGLVRIDDPQDDRPHFITYTTADGLSSNEVSCVTEDQSGLIYLGTGRGVDRLDPASGRIKHYTAADGLVRSLLLAAYSDHRGVLWFGNENGLSRFKPEFEMTPDSPRVLIEGLKIAGVAQQLSQLGETYLSGLELAAGRNQIEIEFVALAFGAAERLRYQYLLEGAGQEWSEPTELRTVSYPNLAPGRYRFAVRAVNSEGGMSESPAIVEFRILPPIWQRWWFLTIAALLVAALVYTAYRYRVARLIEIERVRTRIASDLHDDIGSNLSLIAMISDVANRQAPGVDSRMDAWLSLIASTSRDTVDSMSDIVWAINPNKDRLLDLTHRMRRIADDIFTARDTAFRFSAPGKETDVRLGADTRREIFMIFKEAVNNIVRHSQCTQAEIEFRVEDSRLVLKVSDNGKGVDLASVTEGNGLTSMRRRAKNLGGELEFISFPGGGTTALLRVPLDGRRRF